MGKKPVSVETNWQIVAYYKLKYTQCRISTLCNVSRYCVQTTIKNYKDNNNVADKPRSGRPRITSEKQDQKLFNAIRRDPTASVRDLASSWTSCGQQLASKSTVASRLLEFDLQSYLALEKPLLKCEDMRIRLEWCLQRRNWSYAKWASVIFSDECNFEVINRKTRPLVRRFRDEKHDPNFVKTRVQGGGGSIGFWGCITEPGTGCCTVYTGRMDQDKYLNTLENSLIPSKELIICKSDDWKFQQDNAPCHKAKRVTEWLAQNEIDVLPWPARSPDLNPIEHLWAYMDRKLLETPVSTMAELELALQRHWREIPRDLCANLVESMPRRVEACIKARGGYFKY